jgi:hypothetical protein
MNDPNRDRWNTARSEVVARWRQVVERIEARDEGGTLALTTEMDEFCDEAIAERTTTDLPAGGEQKPPPSGQAAPGQPEQMCHFCRGFIQYGGCAGLTQEFNRAILSGDWDKARSLAEGYIGRLQGMDFSAS